MAKHKNSFDTSASGELKTIAEFIAIALQSSRARLNMLGLEDNALLDPEASIDQQVAVLRVLFLEAEQSCLPFDAANDRFWRVMRARLQPVVLAYLTHEKFVQTLDIEARELRPDTLMQVYKDRLGSSDRFRSFFFDLDKRLKQEALSMLAADDGDGGNAAQLAPPLAKGRPKHSLQDSKAVIEKNILAGLEKQLQDLEKKYNVQEKELHKTQQQVAEMESALADKEARVTAYKKQISTLEEQNQQLRLALDAREREYQPVQSLEAMAQAEPLGDLVLDADQENLLLKIESMERELASTSDAAYNAFMANSDLGIIILFMLTSFKCRTHEQLAAEVVKSVSTFGLKAIVGMQKGNAYTFIHEAGSGTLKSLLQSKISSGKTVDAPHLMLFEESCCILIESPPLADEERYARLKDNLGTLMRGVQARYGSILAETSVQKQKSQVDALIVRSNEVFRTFESNLDKQKDKMSRVINMLGQEMRKNLGIPPGDQKSIRLNMDLKKLEDSLGKLFVQNELVDPAFKKNISRVAENLLKKNKPEL